MKVTPINKPIIVQATEVVGVNIELTKTQALYLFHLLGAICPQDAVKTITKSIRMHSQHKYLLEEVDIYSVNELIIDPIYDGIKEVLNIEID